MIQDNPVIKDSEDFWFEYERWHKRHPLKPGGTAFMWCGDEEDVYGLGGSIVKVTIDEELTNGKFKVHMITYNPLPEAEPFSISIITERSNLFGHIDFILERQCGKYRNLMRRDLMQQQEFKRRHEEAARDPS